MECPRCGAENAINRLYCDECGAELEHKLEEIQAGVEKEIHADQARATAHSVRWFLGVAFLLFIAGLIFRNAYRDLPGNDVVAFVSAPAVPVSELESVSTTDFGVPVPELRPVQAPRPTVSDGALWNQVTQEAYLAGVVVVRQKKGKEPLSGLFLSDLVLYLTPEEQKAPVAVQVPAIRSLRPVANGLWEVAAQGLEKPLRGPILDADKIVLQLLKRGTDEKAAIPLNTVEEIKPLGAAQ